MNKKIYFIENSISFTSNDINSNDIRGTEKALINLTSELAKNKYDVCVFNRTSTSTCIADVKWININDYKSYSNPDFLVAWSDANLLNYFNSKKKFLWSHSIQTIEKFFRKKQFLSFYKNKPLLITEGDYHYNNRSFITAPFGKKIIKLAVDNDFLDVNIDISFLPGPNAIFTTRPDRNIFILIDAWEKIYRLNNKSHLYINPPFYLKDDHIRKNIHLRNAGDKKDLINDLLKSRVMLVPGHKGEVFCLSALEAKELCLPIVTMGYGSLYERVIHEKTGFIAKNINEFAHYSSMILNDDEVFKEFRTNLIKIRGLRRWQNVANEFASLLEID